MRLARPIALSLLLAVPALAQDGEIATQTRAFDQVAAGWSGLVSPRFDPGTARLVEVIGRARVAPFGVDEGSLAHVARQLIGQLEPVLGVAALELHEVQRSQAAGLLAIQLEQRRGGLPIEDSRLDLRFTRDGDLVFLRSRGLWTGAGAPAFAVTRAEAGELARVAVPSGSTEAWAHDVRAVLRVPEGGAGEARPAWRASVDDPTISGGLYTVKIDGVDGTLLGVEARAPHSVDGAIDGRGLILGPRSTGLVVDGGMENLLVQGVDRSALLAAVTGDACDDFDPAISGDGTTVVWVKQCSGLPAEVWISSSDGSGMTALVSNGADSYAPAISFDGSIVWYVSDVDGDAEIYRVAGDGSGTLQLTSNTASDQVPSLAHDGSFGVFQSDVDGDTEIFKVSDDGSGLVQLTSNSSADVDPVLSGDGTKLAFVSKRDGDFEIFSMDADGSGELQLTFNEAADAKPAIAADGLGVVFASTQFEKVAPTSGGPSSGPVGLMGGTLPGTRPRRAFHVWGVASDGGGLTPISGPDGQQLDPTISGDGLVIAYVTRARTSEDWEVEVFSLATGGTLQVTDDAIDQRRPTLSFDGSKGAFENLEADRELIVWDVGASGAVAETLTGPGGTYSLPLPDGASASVSARLTGPYARIKSKKGGNARVGASATAPVAGVDMHFNPKGKKETRLSEVTAWKETNAVHDFLAALMTGPKLALPLPLPIDAPIAIDVNVTPPVANAFFDPGRGKVTYYHSGSGFENGAYDGLIPHETGHAYDHMVGGITSGSSCETLFALSEGLADALTLSYLGGDLVGEDFTGPGTAIRDYATPVDAGGSGTRQWDCLDCPKKGGLPEEHFHGEAFAGFFHDVRTSIGGVLSEELLAGVFAIGPMDQQSAVMEMFLLAATPAFGGFGDPSASPLYDDLCTAAAKHGFLCPPNPDVGSHACVNALCGPIIAMHQIIGTEWLGAAVSGPDPLPCVFPPDPDDDGVTMPPAVMSGETKSFTVTVSVNPALKDSGRYGGDILGGGPNLLRHVYLNGWLYVDDTMGGFVPTKVIGTGSVSSTSGPAGFGANTVAFNPDTWAGSTTTFTFDIDFPVVADPTPAILRLRLDYGEDAGEPAVKGLNCLSDATLGEDCGKALFGEVEDHHTWIMP